MYIYKKDSMEIITRDNSNKGQKDQSIIGSLPQKVEQCS